MGTLISRMFFGALAGVAVWAVMEPFAPANYTGAGWELWEQTFIFTYCGLVGLVIGGFDGYARGGKIHFLRGLGLGLLFGVVAGMFGYSAGGNLVRLLFGSEVFGPGSNIVSNIIARTIVLAILGFCVGAGIGASSLTKTRTIQGAIGGLIGGAIGGACFDIVGSMVGAVILQVKGEQAGEVGGPSRGIAFTVLAACIALFIGLVERLTRSAWLRLSLGRNEGKEWSIDANQTFLGRDERASIPLMGDPNVALIHASITRNGGQYLLADAGSAIGTLLNGQRISQAILTAGSMIQIGSFNLQFLIKGTPAPAMAPEAYRAPVYPLAPQPQAPSALPPIPIAAVPTQTFPRPVQPAAAPSIGFFLVALDGAFSGQRFQVSGPFEIGREGSGLKLPDPSASRRHAVFAPAAGGVTVTDLGSTNGTFLNGQRIATAEAHVGDVVRIGGVNFRVEVA